MSAQGYNTAPIPPKPTAEFEIEDYNDPNAAARWQQDSGARPGPGGQQPPGPGNGRPRGQAPAPPPGYAPNTAGRGATGAFPPPAGSRRPSPSLGLPPLVQPGAGAQQAPPRTFARALGMPGAGAPMMRARSSRPFEMTDLEAISRESVDLWKSLIKCFPGYFHSPELADAAFDFLRSILGEGAAPARAITLEIKRREDGGSESRETYDQEITIGTHTQNTLQVMSAQVSRRHCRIVHDERGYCLVDQGSSNGTFLRGERVQPGYAYPLKNGEAFSIPGHEIAVKWQEGDTAPKLASVKVAGLRIEPAARFFEGTPAQGLVAIVRLEPAGLRLFLELDLPLAALAVSRVLGPTAGQGAAASASSSGAGVPIRPLSEVEKGVLELLVVKLLDSVQKRWGERAELTFHLERLVEARDASIRDQAGTGKSIVASVGIEFDSRRDSVRVALPDATLAGLAPRLENLVPRGGDAMVEILHRLKDAVGAASVEVRAVGGRSKLTRGELAGLSVGDIIVPDEFALVSTATGLGGKVDLRMGGGAGEGELRMRGELLGWDGNLYQVRIEEFLKGSGRREAQVSNQNEVQLEGDPAAAEGQEVDMAAQMQEGGAEAEGAQILEDVPLPLVVELGRLNMTVREIAELRRGQVIELGRGPSEPVALVVEGRMIGAGKLVNVEGEIGVQITNLAR